MADRDPLAAAAAGRLTSSGFATYQSLRARAVNHDEALAHALDGVDVDAARGVCPACGKAVYVSSRHQEWACFDVDCVRGHGSGSGGGVPHTPEPASKPPALPRHLRPHAAFGDDPSGWCGCADCDPRPGSCGCRPCLALQDELTAALPARPEPRSAEVD